NLLDLLLHFDLSRQRPKILCEDSVRHRRLIDGEKDHVIGHQCADGVEIAGAAGLAPALEDFSDLLSVATHLQQPPFPRPPRRDRLRSHALWIRRTALQAPAWRGPM